MKTIIIEDEPLIAKNLERLLRQADQSIEILAILDSVVNSVNWLRHNPAPDLIFMDIQLSDGVSFDIFEQVPVEAPVIFTTAYHEYAIRAFKVNSVDYLLKPIDKEYLEAALQKFKKYHRPAPALLAGQLQDLLRDMRQPQRATFRERFLAHYKSGMVPVAESQVAGFVKDNIIYLITADNEKLVTDYNTIDEIEEVVNPARFFRANRQMIIHIHQVATYRKHDTGKIEVHLKVDPHLRVDISREKANAFVEWLTA